MISIGFVLNPFAGLGGPAGLKGSDGSETQASALAAGFKPLAEHRAALALKEASASLPAFRWLTMPAPMGAQCLESLGVRPTLTVPGPVTPEAADTIRAAQAFASNGADLVLFAGGDGTARDVLAGIPAGLPVLGIPAGVKMYSGVFVSSPGVLGTVFERLLRGGLVRCRPALVVDIDEQALREGKIGTRSYGEASVPDLGGYVQQTKVAGREDERLAVMDIAADIEERVADHRGPVVFGPGSTVAQISENIVGSATLLGVDVRAADGQLHRDVDAHALERLAPPEESLVIVSFLRGQGFLFGRGNQQLRAAWLARLQPQKLCVVATRSKLASLEGGPLLVDTGDPLVDARLAGMMRVLAGYQDELLYRVATHG